MLTRVMLRVLAVIIAAINTSLLGTAHGASPTVTIQDPRPLAKAIEALENRYGWQITYEDPPYAYQGDLSDVTLAVQKAPGPNVTIIPKESSLSFTVPANPSAMSVAVSLIRLYNAQIGTIIFAIRSDGGLLHVVPDRMAGVSGTIEPVKPILDTVIAVEQKERSALELLREICSQLSIHTNTDIRVGTVPLNVLMYRRTSIGSRGEMARSILGRLILESGTGGALPLSWQMFYDPGLRLYAINIDVISKKT